MHAWIINPQVILSLFSPCIVKTLGTFTLDYEYDTEYEQEPIGTSATFDFKPVTFQSPRSSCWF